MEIKLDLTEHCIETESKLIYNRLIRRYFKSINNREDLELAIETLKSFLEQVDFSEPLIRINDHKAILDTSDWSEESAWDEMAKFYLERNVK